MGTSCLLAIKKDGDYKVAQYGNKDGYIKYTGFKILEFIKDRKRLSALKDKLSNCIYCDSYIIPIP